MDQAASRLSFATLQHIVADAKDNAVLKGRIETGPDGKVTNLFLKAGRSPASVASLVGILTGKRKEQTAQARELIRAVVESAVRNPGLTSKAAADAINSLQALLDGKRDVRVGDVRHSFETLARETQDHQTTSVIAKTLDGAVKMTPPIQVAAKNLFGGQAGPGESMKASPAGTLQAVSSVFDSAGGGQAKSHDAAKPKATLALSPQFQSALQTLSGHFEAIERVSSTAERKREAEKKRDGSALKALNGDMDITVADAMSKALGTSAMLRNQSMAGPHGVLTGPMQVMTRVGLRVTDLMAELDKKPGQADPDKIEALCKEITSTFPGQLATLKSMATALEDQSAFVHLPDDARKMLDETAKALKDLVSALTHPKSPYIQLYQFAQAAQADPAAALGAAQAALKAGASGL